VFEAERRLLGRGFSNRDYPITGPTSAGNNQLVTYFGPDLWGATNFQWIIPPGWELVSGQGSRFLTLRAPAFGSGTSQIGLRVAHDCDIGGSPAIKLTNYCSGCILSGQAAPLSAPAVASNALYLFPNPASNQVTVAVGANRGQPSQMELATVNGQVVRSLAAGAFAFDPGSGQFQASIDLANLPAGIYLVRLWLANEIATLKLVVQPASPNPLSN
jgi:Secretion system C-terminal sorting domain/PKD-like domain